MTARLPCLETFPLFLALIMIVHAAAAYGELSRRGAVLYLAGRIAYLPLYAFGVFMIRSLAWNVATGGMLLLLASALRSLHAWQQ
jgi:uncharacterized MAPEG superfamily protein